MHVHIGVPEFFTIWLAIIIGGFFWRTLSAKLHDSPWGQAMAYIY